MLVHKLSLSDSWQPQSTVLLPSQKVAGTADCACCKPGQCLQAQRSAHENVLLPVSQSDRSSLTPTSPVSSLMVDFDVAVKMISTALIHINSSISTMSQPADVTNKRLSCWEYGLNTGDTKADYMPFMRPRILS